MLNKLLTTNLIEWWVTKLIQTIEKNNGRLPTHYLKGIELKRKNKREVRHNLYVSEMRDISAIKVELIKTLVNNLKKRFTIDENKFSKLENCIQLKEKVNIKQVHTLISADLNLRDLSLQYNNLLLHSEINIFRKYNLRELVINISRYTLHISYIYIYDICMK